MIISLIFYTLHCIIYLFLKFWSISSLKKYSITEEDYFLLSLVWMKWKIVWVEQFNTIYSNKMKMMK